MNWGSSGSMYRTYVVVTLRNVAGLQHVGFEHVVF